MMSVKTKVHRLYYIWQGMRQRCYNSSHPAFKYYGGRGIAICDEWQDFDNFFIWALGSGYSIGLTIDREDGNGNYRPDNCEINGKRHKVANPKGGKVVT